MRSVLFLPHIYFIIIDYEGEALTARMKRLYQKMDTALATFVCHCHKTLCVYSYGKDRESTHEVTCVLCVIYP